MEKSQPEKRQLTPENLEAEIVRITEETARIKAQIEQLTKQPSRPKNQPNNQTILEDPEIFQIFCVWLPILNEAKYRILIKNREEEEKQKEMFYIYSAILVGNNL